MSFQFWEHKTIVGDPGDELDREVSSLGANNWEPYGISPFPGGKIVVGLRRTLGMDPKAEKIDVFTKVSV